MPSKQIISRLVLLSVLYLFACEEQAKDSATGQTATPTSSTEAEAAIAAAKQLAQEQQGPGQLPAGHPPTGQLPAGHPPVDPGSAPTGKATAAAGSEAADNAAGGLRWEPKEPLTPVPPSSSMRAAEYRVEGSDGAGPAVLTVFYFGAGQGGSVDANLERWISQFKQPDGSDNHAAAKFEDQEIGGLPVKRLDLRGTFMGGMGPMQGGGEPMTDHRVLGAIVTGPKGPVFFKLLGPAATVDRAQAGFDGMIGSIKAE